MNVSAAANESPGIGLPLRNFGLSLTSKIVSLGAHLAFVMLTARLFSKEEVAVIAVIGIVTMVQLGWQAQVILGRQLQLQVQL